MMYVLSSLSLPALPTGCLSLPTAAISLQPYPLTGVLLLTLEEALFMSKWRRGAMRLNAGK